MSSFDARAIEPLDAEEIRDGEVLSQRVSRGPDSQPDIDQPRPKDRGKVSVVRGRKSPAELFHLVRKGHTRDNHRDDGARYTTAGELRGAGFTVEHSPNRRNPDHVSVSYSADWDAEVALLFKSCFADPTWGEGVDSDE